MNKCNSGTKNTDLTNNFTAATIGKNMFEQLCTDLCTEIRNLQTLREQEKQAFQKMKTKSPTGDSANTANLKQNEEFKNISKKNTKLIQELEELKEPEKCSVCYELFDDDVH